MPLAWWNSRSIQLKCVFISLSIIGVYTVTYLSVNHYKNDRIVTEEPQSENVTFLNLTRSQRSFLNLTRSRRSFLNADNSELKRISFEENTSINGIMINGKFFSGTITLLGEAPKTINVSCIFDDRKNSVTLNDKPFQFGIALYGKSEINGIILNGSLFHGTIRKPGENQKLDNISCILEYNLVQKIAAVEMLDPLSAYRTESYGEELDANPFYNFEVIPGNETEKNQIDQKSGKIPAGETVTYPTTTIRGKPDPAAVEVEGNTEPAKTATTAFETGTITAGAVKIDTTDGNTDEVASIELGKNVQEPAQTIELNSDSGTKTETQSVSVNAVEVDISDGSTGEMASVEPQKNVEEPAQTTESNSELDTNVKDSPDIMPNTLSESTNPEFVSDQELSIDQESPSEQESIAQDNYTSCYADNSSGMADPDSESIPSSLSNHASHTVAAEVEESPLPHPFSQNVHRISAAPSNQKPMLELLSSVRESLQQLENIAGLLPVLGSGIMESKTGHVNDQGMPDFLKKEKIEDRNKMSQELSPLMTAMKTEFLKLASNTNASEAMADIAKKLNKSKIQFPPVDYVGTIDKMSNHEDKKKNETSKGKCKKVKCNAPQSIGNVVPTMVSLFRDAISVSSTDRLTKLENGQIISNAYVPKSGIAIPPETLESVWPNMPHQESNTEFACTQKVENSIYKLFPALAAMERIKSDDPIKKLFGEKPASIPFDLAAIIASLKMADDDDTEEDLANEKRIRRQTSCFIQLIDGKTKNVPCEDIGKSNLAADEDKASLTTMAPSSNNTDASGTTSSNSEVLTTKETDNKKNDPSSVTSEKNEAGTTEVVGTTSADGHTNHTGTSSADGHINHEDTTSANGHTNHEGTTSADGHTNHEGTTSADGYTIHDGTTSANGHTNHQGTTSADGHKIDEGTASPDHITSSNGDTSEAPKPDVGMSTVMGMTTIGRNSSLESKNETSTWAPSSKNTTNEGTTCATTSSNSSCHCSDKTRSKSSSENSKKNDCDDCDFNCDVDDLKDDDFCDLPSCKKRVMERELDSSEVTTASNMANSKQVKLKKKRDVQDIKTREIVHVFPLAMSDAQSPMKDIKDIWGLFTIRDEKPEAPKFDNRFEPSLKRFLRRNLFHEVSLDLTDQPFAHFFNNHGNDGVASNIPLDTPSLNGLLKKLAEMEDNSGTVEETCKGLDGKENCKIQRVERKKVEVADAGCASNAPKEKKKESSCLQESSEEKCTTTTSTEQNCRSTKGEDNSAGCGAESHEVEHTTAQDDSSDEPVAGCGNRQAKEDCGRSKRNARHKFRQIPVRKMFRNNLRADMDDHLMNSLIGIQSLIDSFNGIDSSGNIGSIPMEVPSLDDLFKEILTKFNDDSSNNIFRRDEQKGRQVDKIEEMCNVLRNEDASEVAQDCNPSGMNHDSESLKEAQDGGSSKIAQNYDLPGVARDCKPSGDQTSQTVQNYENEPSSVEGIAQDCKGKKKSQSTTTSDRDWSQTPSVGRIADGCKEKKKSIEKMSKEDNKSTGRKITYLTTENVSTLPSDTTGGCSSEYNDVNTHFSTSIEFDHSTRTTFMNSYATETTKSDTLVTYSGKSNDRNTSCRTVIVSSTDSLNEEDNKSTGKETTDLTTENVSTSRLYDTVGSSSEYNDENTHSSTNMESDHSTRTTFLNSDATETKSDTWLPYSVKSNDGDTSCKTVIGSSTNSLNDVTPFGTENKIQMHSDATTSVNFNDEVKSTEWYDGIYEENEMRINATTDETTILYESQFTKTTNVENFTDNVCLNSNCILTAADIIRIVDLESNPCDDFYQFSCGKFIDDVTIPQYKIAVNQINLLNDRQLDRVKILLNNPTSQQDPVAVKEAKKFYNACLSEGTLENELNSLEKLITSKIGGSWPVSSQMVFEMDQYVTAVSQLGVDPNHFITFTVESFNGKYLLHVSSAKLSLPGSVLVLGLENSTVDAYFDFMMDVAELLNVEAQVKEDLERILNFEVQLAKIVTSVEEFEQKGLYYTKMKLVEVIKKYPHIDWNVIMKTFTPEGTPLIDSTEIVFKHPYYMDELVELLKNTSDSVQYNFVIWRIIAKVGLIVSPEISEKFHAQFQGIANSFERLDGIFDGTTIILEDRPRWVECIDATKRAYSVAVSYMYAQKYFDLKSKSKVRNIALAVRNKIKDLVVSSKLMDEKTRNYATDKIEAMEVCIGYDEKITDRKGVDNYYQGISTDHMKFLYWYQEINVFELKKKFSQLHLQSEHCDNLLALGDYARYRFESNDFIIAARYLQNPLFDVHRPDNMNFGSVGSAIAHFMLHSIIFEGRYFDKTGANVSNGWWGQKTLKNFISISQCLTEDYLRLKPSAVTSFKTINEFIVEVGAIEVVYQAYKQFSRDDPEPFRLPGLEKYTEDQSFWLSFGSTICTKTRLDPTAEIRLTLGVRNSNEFGNDYHCPKNTKMNPTIKCSMWI